MIERLLSACLATALLAALPVQAEVAGEDKASKINLSGHWTFVASLRNGCSFQGTAHLSAGSDNTYTGELTARQSCLSLPEDFIVRQLCDATQLGRQLSVRCHIVEFVNGFESDTYYPDNFTLTVASNSRMHGALVSTGNPKPAEWTRAEGAIS